ncbi:beta-ketoacyl synthase N-terminal-like domain-containing protein [Kitasatospora sp. MAA4]|uniref:beta-ketoacyl-[acyl-carrier-protein] synthase family protein n=1 Tax=Kitasatospora sp. MAA4 TaxID=3035093 RepID=UPI00247466D4|nr:beta-ketoacyl synthase N-terminal-like domain-containing protein [Kitasatospora sp. MAA4]
MTGLDALTAHGRGAAVVQPHITAGRAAFSTVDRFAVQRHRVHRAALLPEAGTLLDELAGSVQRACGQAELDVRTAARDVLLLAVHSDEPTPQGPLSRALSARCGLPAVTRLYTTACVAGSTAVADAAALIASGRADRVVVAAGYLVEPIQYALFDAGRALARDGEVRPFSADRRGALLGDGVAAVVLEAAESAAARGVQALAVLAGWGRAGDAHHVVRPRPDGAGLARAIECALRRGGIGADQVGYVNANANGAVLGDSAEVEALRLVFGKGVGKVPVSSTKGVHGHALEGSALLELVVTVEALRSGRLPVQAGLRAPDPQCPLDLVRDLPRESAIRYALSLNSAFGGANTALLVGAA